MSDKIDKIGNSIVHHGKSSNRVYLMSLDADDLPNIAQKLDRLAAENAYTKIVVKTPVCYKDIFESNGYKTEAEIPRLYNGEKDGCFVCKYLDSERKNDLFHQECTRILKLAEQKKSESPSKPLNRGMVCRQATEQDVPAMTEIYQRVFKTYPFPIFEEEYLLKTMKENVIYYGIWDNNNLVALSSIESCLKYSNAEMTDFAVLDEYRGEGLGLHLLQIMEEKLSELQIQTAFTIARSKSAGMNITFAKNGYTYAGTLINNTDISGQIESMNVWYKAIPKQH